MRQAAVEYLLAGLNMKYKAQVIVVVVLSLMLVESDGQVMLSDSTRAISPQPFGTTARIFAEFPAFSALYEMQFQSTLSVPVITMSGRVFRLDAKWRWEIDMGRMFTNRPFTSPFANDSSGPDDLDSLTNLTVTMVWRPDKNVVWRSYSFPGAPVNGYFEQRLRDSASERTEPSATSSKVGQDTVDDHPCVVNRFSVSETQEKILEYRVWNVIDLRGFPIRIQWIEHNNTNILLFKNVTLVKPDTSLFEPPASKRYGAASLLLDALKAIKKARAVPSSLSDLA